MSASPEPVRSDHLTLAGPEKVRSDILDVLAAYPAGLIAAAISQQLGMSAAPNGRRNDRTRRALKRLLIDRKVSRQGNLYFLKTAGLQP